MAVQRHDTRHVDAAERRSAEHYRRYLTLVVRGTDAGWPYRRRAAEGPFRVLDSAYSAILARACRDLADVARELGEGRIADESAERSDRVSAALRARARSDGLIPPVDLRDGSTLDAPSVGLALTVLAPDIDRRTREAAKALVEGPLDSPFGSARSRAMRAAGPRATIGAGRCGRTPPG
jgi:hypothetical protein